MSKAIENLEMKLQNTGFRSDVNNLISPTIDNYDPDGAAAIVVNEYLRNI